MYIVSTGSLGLIEINKCTKNEGPLYYMSNTQHCNYIIISYRLLCKVQTNNDIKGLPLIREILCVFRSS